MTMFHCEVARIENIEPIAGADNIVKATILGYPVIIKKDEYKIGDLASYICVDAVLKNHPIFSFLGKDVKRLRAKRLRGVFSQGLIVNAPDGFKEGDSVIEHFNITRWIAPEERQDYSSDGLSVNGKNGQNEKAPENLGVVPYYDIHPLRKYKKHFEGKNVVITEKLEGQNCVFCYWNDELHVKSRNNWKKKSDESQWWEVPIRENYEEKFSKYPGLAFWGELYGNVSGFRYDCKIEGTIVHRKFRVFDIFDVANQKFLEYDNVKEICKELDLEMVPELYRGPWLGEVHYDLANGNSTIGDHIKEGFVVKVIPESRHENQFSQLKFIGEEYLLRK